MTIVHCNVMLFWIARASFKLCDEKEIAYRSVWRPESRSLKNFQRLNFDSLLLRGSEKISFFLPNFMATKTKLIICSPCRVITLKVNNKIFWFPLPVTTWALKFVIAPFISWQSHKNCTKRSSCFPPVFFSLQRRKLMGMLRQGYYWETGLLKILCLKRVWIF